MKPQPQCAGWWSKGYSRGPRGQYVNEYSAEQQHRRIH